MKIVILCVGKIKEKYWDSAILEYMKRLTRYAKIEIIEVNDEKAPENMSLSDELIVMEKEGLRLSKNIKETDFVVTLEIDGKMISSENLAKHIEEFEMNVNGRVVFIIGGSLGIAKSIKERSNLKISFSKMTFPHQMIRVILLEQIYRGYRILRGEPYHK